MTAPGPFRVQYLTPEALGEFLAAGGRTVIGAVGYGAERPPSLPGACPFSRAELPVVGGPAGFEVWSTPGEARYGRTGPIAWARTDALAFGLIALDEASGRPIEAPVGEAYRGIFDFIEGAGYAAPIRFWNYLPLITAEQDGLERYRRFNIGPHDAFSARLRLPVPPVASALGSRGGAPLICFLAAHAVAVAIENPRQVSAYAYPPIHGPRGPGFSRAALHMGPARRQAC